MQSYVFFQEDWQKAEMKKILYTAASSGTLHNQGKMAITLIKKMKSKTFDTICNGL